MILRPPTVFFCLMLSCWKVINYYRQPVVVVYIRLDQYLCIVRHKSVSLSLPFFPLKGSYIERSFLCSSSKTQTSRQHCLLSSSCSCYSCFSPSLVFAFQFIFRPPIPREERCTQSQSTHHHSFLVASLLGLAS